MMPAKFKLVPQGGKAIGIGHLRRMISLGEAAVELGHEVLFVTKYLEDGLAAKVNGKFSTTNLESEKESHLDNEYLVLDGYEIPIQEFQDHENLVVFEDYVHRNLKCKFLVDANFSKDSLSKYGHYSYQSIIEGEKFISLGPEYRKTAKIRDFVSKPRLLISLGGSDSENFTEIVLEAITKERGRFSDISVAIGPLNRNEARLRHEFSQQELNWVKSPESLFTLYETHDVAIGAGGTSAYERVNRNLPSLNLITVDNQERVALGTQALGLALATDVRKSRKLDVNLLSYFFEERQTSKTRRSGNTIIDGFGSKRLIETLLTPNGLGT